MKKLNILVCLLLVVVFAISICSCGVNKEARELSAIMEEEDSDLIVIGFSQPGAESAWRVALTESVINAFPEEKGYKLIYKDGQSKQDNQIKDIRTFIQQGVDYIILSPIVETGWDSVLKEAKEAGIPVVVCDRNVVVSNESLYVAFVGSNFKAEGEKAVSYIEKLAENREDPEAEFNIVHIQGTLGSSAQLGRSKALNAAVEKNENWNIIAEDCGDFTKGKTREIMKGILNEISYEDIDVVYCENDEEAFGVIAAFNEESISYGLNKEIAIVSFDGGRMALEMCDGGLINMVVECNPLQGPYLYQIIDSLSKGDIVPKIMYIDEDVFTADTLDNEFIEAREY